MYAFTKYELLLFPTTPVATSLILDVVGSLVLMESLLSFLFSCQPRGLSIVGFGFIEIEKVQGSNPKLWPLSLENEMKCQGFTCVNEIKNLFSMVFRD